MKAGSDPWGEVPEGARWVGADARTVELALQAMPRLEQMVRVREFGASLGANQIIDQPNSVDQATLALERIEQIFGGEDGLASLARRSPDHPALRQRARLEEALATVDKSMWPNEIEMLELHNEVLMDSMSWAPAPPYEDIFGELDEAARRWVVPSLRDPGRFEDVMAELYFWGRLRSGGHECRLLEGTGMPDLAVARGKVRHYCEVKRIHPGTKPSRIAAVIKDANRKFKRADPEASGSLLVSVGRSPGRTRLDERIPNDIASYLEAARAALQGHQYRSVAEVFICWDDFVSSGIYPEPVVHALVRRGAKVSHPKALPAAIALVDRELMMTIVTGTPGGAWGKRKGNAGPLPAMAPIRSGDVVVTEFFRQTSELLWGVRPGHALEVLREPDCLVRRQESGLAEIILATRRSDQPRNSVLLVFAVQIDEKPLQVQGAFPLTKGMRMPESLEFDPLRAFGFMLGKFGRDVRLDRTVGRFIRRIDVAVDAPFEWQDEGDSVCYSLQEKNADRIDYAWVFSIDVGRYKASLGLRT